jgi:16S rRNA (cytidine1402-2'-O)-methyltransferase
MSSPPSSYVGSGRLIVCPTPIGNSADLSERCAAALRGADLVACEDTRRTGSLLAQLGAHPPLMSLHEHNETARIEALVARVRAGDTVVLVSDAGTPTISDPGYPLIRAVVDAGLPLTVLPGPSAVLVAVVASGLPVHRWTFVGFLPRKRGALEKVLSDPHPLVAFESPRRLARTLELLAGMGPDRPVAVCRELTKTFEEVVRGTAATVREHFVARPPLGEVVVVLGEAPPAAGIDAYVDAVARLATSGARPREAAAVVAALTGASKNELYDAWLLRR